jgi:hypothetical protein
LIIKQTPNNQSLKNSQEILPDKGDFISPYNLVLPNSTRLHLLQKTDGINSFVTRMFRFPRADRIAERVRWMFFLDLGFECGDSVKVFCCGGGVVESFFKVLGCAGDFIGVTVSDDARIGIGYGGEEIGCCLAGGTFEAEFLEVWFCVIGGAEEDASAFVDNKNFIE